MRRLGRSLAATHPLLSYRRGATATTQLLLATLPRYLFCHIERSEAQSKYLSIVGFLWVRFACWVLLGTAYGLCGVCGVYGLHALRGLYEKIPTPKTTRYPRTKKWG